MKKLTQIIVKFQRIIRRRKKQIINNRIVTYAHMRVSKIKKKPHLHNIKIIFNFLLYNRRNKDLKLVNKNDLISSSFMNL